MRWSFCFTRVSERSITHRKKQPVLAFLKNIPKSKEHQHKEEFSSTKGQNSQLISNGSNPKFKLTKSPNQKIQTKSNGISKDISLDFVDNVYFVCLKWRALLSLFVLDLSSSPEYRYQFSVSLNLNLIMGLMYLGVKISYYYIYPFILVSL